MCAFLIHLQQQMIFQIRSIQSSKKIPRKNGGREGGEKRRKITSRAVWRASTEAIMRDYRELLNLPVCTD